MTKQITTIKSINGPVWHPAERASEFRSGSSLRRSGETSGMSALPLIAAEMQHCRRRRFDASSTLQKRIGALHSMGHFLISQGPDRFEKLVVIVTGSGSSFSMRWIWSTASPSAAPGASLNEIVIPGSVRRELPIASGLLICKSELTSWRKGSRRMCASTAGARAVKLVEIVRLKRVLIGIEVPSREKETKEVISAGKKNQQQTGE
jgi:hypothetical protein